MADVGIITLRSVYYPNESTHIKLETDAYSRKLCFDVTPRYLSHIFSLATQT